MRACRSAPPTRTCSSMFLPARSPFTSYSPCNDQQIAAVDVPIEATTSEPLLCGSYDWTYGTEQDGSKSNFRTPLTYCYAGIAVIAGTFNGDAQQTFDRSRR